MRTIQVAACTLVLAVTATMSAAPHVTASTVTVPTGTHAAVSVTSDDVARAAEHVLLTASAVQELVDVPGEPHPDTMTAATGAYVTAMTDLAVLIAAPFPDVNPDRLSAGWLLMPSLTRTATMWALTTVGERYERDPYLSMGATGYDCSGLTLAAWHQVHVPLSHKAAVQQIETTPVPVEDVQPGDLQFFVGGDTAIPPLQIGHVGIVLGEGLMVNARAGIEQVAVERISDIADRYPADYAGRVNTVRESSTPSQQQ